MNFISPAKPKGPASNILIHISVGELFIKTYLINLTVEKKNHSWI